MATSKVIMAASALCLLVAFVEADNVAEAPTGNPSILFSAYPNIHLGRKLASVYAKAQANLHGGIAKPNLFLGGESIVNLKLNNLPSGIAKPNLFIGGEASGSANANLVGSIAKPNLFIGGDSIGSVKASLPSGIAKPDLFIGGDASGSAKTN